MYLANHIALTPDASAPMLYFIGGKSNISNALLNSQYLSQNGLVFLFTEPNIGAHFFKNQDRHTVDLPEIQSTIPSIQLLACKITERMECKTIDREPKSWRDIVEYGNSVFDTDNEIIKIQYAAKNEENEVAFIYILTEHKAKALVPIYAMLCVEMETMEIEEKMTRAVQSIAMPSFGDSEIINLHGIADPTNEGSKLIDEFHQKAANEIKVYHDRLFRDIDPDIAQKSKHLSREADNINEIIFDLRSKISDQKFLQVSESCFNEKPNFILFAGTPFKRLWGCNVQRDSAVEIFISCI